MMTKCPECGSTDIIPELIVFGDYEDRKRPAMVFLVNPAQKGQTVAAGFRAAVCGGCGHTELYTKGFEDLLDAHRKGFVTQSPT